ncbi:unnamed protein product, partial [Laminaria digitata]
GAPVSVVVTLRGKKYDVKGATSVSDVQKSVEEQAGLAQEQQSPSRAVPDKSPALRPRAKPLLTHARRPRLSSALRADDWSGCSRSATRRGDGSGSAVTAAPPTPTSPTPRPQPTQTSPTPTTSTITKSTTPTPTPPPTTPTSTPPTARPTTPTSTPPALLALRRFRFPPLLTSSTKTKISAISDFFRGFGPAYTLAPTVRGRPPVGREEVDPVAERRYRAALIVATAAVVIATA